MAYTTIDKPTDYFETLLWSSVDTSIDTLSFQPDWAWIKSRTNADTQVLFDSVRGANKRLSSSGTTEEQTTSDELTAFNSNGYTLGTGDNVNRASNNYVSWNWRAGGTASSNSNGSITSSVSANTDAGFSIVSYTGTGSNATVGHGLGAVPKMVIAKGRSNTGTWSVYHDGIGNAANGVSLENTSGTRSEAAYWNSTDPTSSVFSVGTSNDTNGSSRTYVAYCFAEKKGYSKFGSFTGNGNANGVFVYLGFRPAFIVIKKSSGTENWSMYDTKRNKNDNEDTLPLNADNNDVESGNTGKEMDILSNGVKMRTSNGELNASSTTYIYWAFAESPFVNSNGVPGNAK